MSAVDAILEDQEYLDEEFVKLSPIAQAVVNWQMKWNKDAHDHQIEPMGDWWNIWLMLAGRGAGKTRAAAETLALWAWEQPNTRWLVSAPTSGDL
jgi:phage terminase large subunit-like protein